MLVSFSRSTNVVVNMSFPNSNFEVNFSTYRDLKSECCKSRHILCKKILNFSYVWRLEFFIKMEICMKLTLSRGHYNKHADWLRLLCV